MIRYVQQCTKPAPAAAFIDYLIDSEVAAKTGFFESPILRHSFLEVSAKSAKYH